MYHEEKATSRVDRDCEFGVFGETLRTLQMEESEQNEACSVEIPEVGRTKIIIETNIEQEISEANVTQTMMELIKEINATLKEIAETQKRILEEIKKNRI